jgi:DNA-binding MarR family transcriptional regulator
MKDIIQITPKSTDLLILQSIRKIIRAINQNSKKLRNSLNITTPQLICLNAINENNNLTLAKLAMEINLSPSTVVGILDRLEKKFLIQRSRGTADRRQIEIKLLPAGKDIIEKTPLSLQDKFLDNLNQLTQDEQIAILGSLDKIVVMLAANNIAALPILITEEEL